MAKLIKGFGIQAIDSDIVADIETLIQVAEAVAKVPIFPDLKGIINATIRVKDYLADYKLEEES